MYVFGELVLIYRNFFLAFFVRLEFVCLFCFGVFLGIALFRFGLSEFIFF